MRVVWKKILEDHQYAQENHQEITAWLFLKIKMVHSKSSIRVHNLLMLELILASSAIKKRKWYIHFLINYLRFVEDMIQEIRK
jgi:hypothetical protein